MTEWPPEHPSATEEELRRLVHSMVAGTVFTSLELEEGRRGAKLMMFCFLPIALGALSKAPESYVKSIGMVYEYRDQSLKMGINGFPVFASCRLLNRHDLKVVLATVQKEIKHQQEMKLEPAP